MVTKGKRRLMEKAFLVSGAHFQFLLTAFSPFTPSLSFSLPK